MTADVKTVTLKQPDDWHLHVRDGVVLEAVLPHTARQFKRAIIMPNLQPPVVNTRQARAYHDRIMDVVRRLSGAARGFTPLMTL